MKLRVYARRSGKLLRLCKIHRSVDGLYIFGRSSGIGGADRDYVSYHEDGNYWIRSAGRKAVKKRRPPLREFAGALTLQSSFYPLLSPMANDREDTAEIVRSDDVVIDLQGPFCIELILSDRPLTLDPLAERLNSKVYVRDHWRPVITFEVFQAAVPRLPSERFPPAEDWVEGVNFFVDHDGRI